VCSLLSKMKTKSMFPGLTGKHLKCQEIKLRSEATTCLVKQQYKQNMDEDFSSRKETFHQACLLWPLQALNL